MSEDLPTKMLAWFETSNPELGYLTPLMMIKVRPDKFAKWIESKIKEASDGE